MSNRDTHTNQNGNELLHIINDSHMYIINGICPGDLKGKYTYHGIHGNSAIYLCIASGNIMSQVLYLKVFKPVWYTDHC